jgi:tetratricopeptide (TPR) repeat protein
MASLHNCQDETVAPGARVDACTAFIHANLVSHPLLANIYAHRALAYEAEGDHAIQDYDKALELKPDYEEAKTNRDRLAELKQQAQPPAAAAAPSGGSP